MYMCSWWFSWTAANSQRARRREMGRGRVQGALGRGIVGTHPLVVWPTMRYFLPAVLERIRWLIRERFSTKSGVLIWNKDISFLYQNKKWIIDPNNPQWPGGFFGSYPNPDTFDTWSQAFLYVYGSEMSEHCPAGSGDSKQFQYIHQLFDYTAHLYGHFIPEAWIKRSALSVLWRW